jgi:hypothetical protein
MKIPESNGDYMVEPVYKYKNVETPAWYEVQAGKVTRIILPHDVGYNGRAYGVIRNMVKVSDGEGNSVDGFVSLTAGRAITWAGSSGLAATNIPEKTDYNGGQVFELQLRNGKVTDTASIDGDFNVPKNTMATEMGSEGDFAEISAKTGDVVTVGGNVIQLRSNASVYVLENGDYSTGTLSSVREKSMVRLYDVSDDKYSAADIVVIAP